MPRLMLPACARIIYEIPIEDLYVIRLLVAGYLEEDVVSEEMRIAVRVHANGGCKIVAQTTPQGRQW
jgi:hypothetical protein